MEQPSLSAGSPAGFDPGAVSAGARAAIVNRTHRVVRERAAQMQAQKKSRRELVLPLLICSAVLLLLCYAGWEVVSGTAFGAVGEELGHTAGKLFTGQTIDTGSTSLLLLFWFLPITVGTVATLLLRRSRQGRLRDNRAPFEHSLEEEETR